MQTIGTTAQRAGEYQKHIAALTGAERVRDGYCVKVGRKTFLVDDGFVRVISHHKKSKCFSVASALAGIMHSAHADVKVQCRACEKAIHITNSFFHRK